MRHGFTLIETLVALVLFQFGMLAVTAAAAVAARDLATAERIVRAQAAARERLELLRAVECPDIAAGTQQSAGLVEHWAVESLGAHRVLRDSVAFVLSRGRQGHVVLRAYTLCP